MSLANRKRAQKEMRRKTIIYFDFDSAEIPDRYLYRLHAIAERLSGRHIAQNTFTIIGHTCNLGPPAYNLNLSRRRAQNVRNYLAQHLKISPDVMTIRGLGETAPLLPDADRNAGTLNRRVEVVIADYESR